MEQHPIPQHISSYEFRLVGDMTLKQFAQLAGGILVAIVFYASGLPWFIKWPFVLTFAILGVALAFLPVGERPLDRWILAFFKAVYSPTQFTWQKKAFVPAILTKQPKAYAAPVKKSYISGDQAKLDQYLESLPVQKNSLDIQEEAFFKNIQDLFQVPLPPNLKQDIEPLPEEPAGDRIRKLGEPTKMENQPLPVPQMQVQPVQQTPVSQIKSAIPNFVPPPISTFRHGNRRVLEEPKFAKDVPLPTLPEQPNIITGMVSDTQGKIIENAILEIRDTNDNPVRALRSNRLGHFRIANPLPNGSYEIITEKDGYLFDAIKIQVTGDILQPIEIKAKSYAS